MPSLAEIVEQSRVAPGKVYTNADLTPAARRHAAGITDEPAVSSADFGRGGHMPTPNGPVESETDRLLADAKGTLAKADPFARMLQNAGTVGAQESLQSHQTPGEAVARSLGNTAVGVFKGARQIPGDLLGGVLGLPGTIAQGLASVPEGLQAIIDPATWRGLPDAAKQNFMELANNPEEATRLFGGMLAAGPASELAGSAASAAPGLAGKAISGVGRGLQAVGNSPLIEGTGLLRKGAAILHPGLGTLAGAVGPEMLSGAGRAVERFGGRVADLPNSPSLEALKKLGNKDVGAAVRDTFTPTPTADELAAGSVRETVNTARGLMNNGQSRAQASQRAGWPLGKSSAEKHTTPGADVEANRPYAPSVRGKNGNVIREGRGSLEALRKVTKREPPTVYAADLLDQPGSQDYMNRQFEQNKPVADRALGKDRPLADLDEASRAEQDYLDAAMDFSPLDRLARLSRTRGQAPAFTNNSLLNEGRY